MKSSSTSSTSDHRSKAVKVITDHLMESVNLNINGEKSVDAKVNKKKPVDAKDNERKSVNSKDNEKKSVNSKDKTMKPLDAKDIIKKYPDEFLEVFIGWPSRETMTNLDIKFINKMSENVTNLLNGTTIDDSNFPEAKKMWLSDPPDNKLDYNRFWDYKTDDENKKAK